MYRPYDTNLEWNGGLEVHVLRYQYVSHGNSADVTNRFLLHRFEIFTLQLFRYQGRGGRVVKALDC